MDEEEKIIVNSLVDISDFSGIKIYSEIDLNINVFKISFKGVLINDQ
jgi:hypothetical protein